MIVSFIDILRAAFAILAMSSIGTSLPKSMKNLRWNRSASVLRVA
jgi:hypothetical protein